MADQLEVFATIRTYSDLQMALRARVSALGASLSTINDVAGLTGNYFHKLISPKPLRLLGPMSFGAVLGSLGLKILLVEDAEQMARIAHRLTPRAKRMARPGGVTRCNGTHARKPNLVSRRFLRKIAVQGGRRRAEINASRKKAMLARVEAKRRGGLARMAKLSGAELAAYQRNAARARWRLRREEAPAGC